MLIKSLLYLQFSSSQRRSISQHRQYSKAYLPDDTCRYTGYLREILDNVITDRRPKVRTRDTRHAPASNLLARRYSQRRARPVVPVGVDSVGIPITSLE